MERFLPDKTQREWLYDWMAHKQARPEIPGTAVLFVADTDDGVREGKFGTGRGMFFKVMHKLYGEEYSRAEDFDILDGSSGQAAYTDWRHNSVLVTVDEAKSSPTSYRRGERSAVYEVLKNIVDPAPKRCRFKVQVRACRSTACRMPRSWWRATTPTRSRSRPMTAASRCWSTAAR